jgi:acyl-CoA reductase-like NAD-dependent aldehyde dehydrogenase
MQEAGVAAPVATHGHWIGGGTRLPSSGVTFPSYNPTTGDVWGKFALGSADDVADAVAAAKTAFATWRTM